MQDDDASPSDIESWMEELAEPGEDCSLEDLTLAYAQLLAEQREMSDSLPQPEDLPQLLEAETAPSNGNHDEATSSKSDETRESKGQQAMADLRKLRSEWLADNAQDTVGVTPGRIIEAILFVGTPDNSAISPRLLASMIRGVSPEEVERYISELNEAYAAEQSAFRITQEAMGYRMVLSPTHHPVRNQFYGQVREVKLPQPVIDVLAVVAYHQPITKAGLEKLMPTNISASLNQLLRRGLVQLISSDGNQSQRQRQYVTTSRFLELFELESLEDLPQSTLLQE